MIPPAIPSKTGFTAYERDRARELVTRFYAPNASRLTRIEAAAHLVRLVAGALDIRTDGQAEA